MSSLENEIAETFRNNGYIVFTRRNHCDVLAIKNRLAYLCECKNYSLSKKQQKLAVRQLNRNYTFALEILLNQRWYVDKIVRVLVAKDFSYQSKGILQYTPLEFIKHIRG